MARLPELPPLARARRIVRLARRGDPMSIVREAMRIGGAEEGEAHPKRRASASPKRQAEGASSPRSAHVRARAKVRTAAPELPEGARWEWRVHAGPHGSRRYRLYVPARASGAAGAPRPLLVMLHGCTQDPDDFAVGTRILAAAERHGVVVALPEQPRDANPMGCWNWFEPAHQGRRGEPGIIAGIAEDVIRAESIDARRVFAAGLSAGGAMAAVLAETHGDVFAAVGVHAGLPHGAARDVASAMAVMRGGAVPPATRRTDGPRLFVMHGDADTTVAPANAEALLAGLAGERRRRTVDGAAVTTVHEPGGRALAESWRVPGLGHAWSGGDPKGSHAAARGPDATARMLRFFLEG